MQRLVLTDEVEGNNSSDGKPLQLQMKKESELIPISTEIDPCAPPEITTKAKNNKLVAIILSAIVFTTILVVGLLFYLIFHRRRKLEEERAKNKTRNRMMKAFQKKIA